MEKCPKLGEEALPHAKSIEHMTELIVRQVGYFNGWYVSDATMRNSCRVAAEKIQAYLKRKGGTR